MAEYRQTMHCKLVMMVLDELAKLRPDYEVNTSGTYEYPILTTGSYFGLITIQIYSVRILCFETGGTHFNEHRADGEWNLADPKAIQKLADFLDHLDPNFKGRGSCLREQDSILESSCVGS